MTSPSTGSQLPSIQRMSKSVPPAKGQPSPSLSDGLGQSVYIKAIAQHGDVSLVRTVLGRYAQDSAGHTGIRRVGPGLCPPVWIRKGVGHFGRESVLTLTGATRACTQHVSSKHAGWPSATPSKGPVPKFLIQNPPNSQFSKSGQTWQEVGED